MYYVKYMEERMYANNIWPRQRVHANLLFLIKIFLAGKFISLYSAKFVIIEDSSQILFIIKIHKYISESVKITNFNFLGKFVAKSFIFRYNAQIFCYKSKMKFSRISI